MPLPCCRALSILKEGVRGIARVVSPTHGPAVVHTAFLGVDTGPGILSPPLWPRKSDSNGVRLLVSSWWTFCQRPLLLQIPGLRSPSCGPQGPFLEPSLQGGLVGRPSLGLCCLEGDPIRLEPRARDTVGHLLGDALLRVCRGGSAVGSQLVVFGGRAAR